MKKIKIVLKSFYISSLIVFCFLFGFLGIAKAYEGIRKIGFGEYRSAVEFNQDSFKFFDFIIEF